MCELRSYYPSYNPKCLLEYCIRGIRDKGIYATNLINNHFGVEQIKVMIYAEASAEAIDEFNLLSLKFLYYSFCRASVHLSIKLQFPFEQFLRRR